MFVTSCEEAEQLPQQVPWPPTRWLGGRESTSVVRQSDYAFGSAPIHLSDSDCNDALKGMLCICTDIHRYNIYVYIEIIYRYIKICLYVSMNILK